jgi:hypothetical protein
MSANIIIHSLHDFGTGEAWETHRFAMIDRLALSAGIFFPSGAGASRGLYTTLWDSILCTDAATGLMSASIPGPYRWNSGTIPGLVFHFGMVGANTSTNVVIQVKLACKNTNVEIASLDVNQQFTTSAPNAANTVRQTMLTFTTPAAYTRFDTIFLQLSRMGADAADTAIGNLAFIGVDLLYQYTGPASPGGTGPWAVPRPNKTDP